MPNQTAPSGRVAMLVLALTWAITLLFGILITRALYRSMITKDASAFYRMVIMNDTLDRIRDAVMKEAISWSAI